VRFLSRWGRRNAAAYKITLLIANKITCLNLNLVYFFFCFTILACMYVYNETSLFPFIFGNKYVANGIHRKVPSNDYISYFF